MIAEPSQFPGRAGPAERLRCLLSYAVLAPSRHNVQPWVFEIEGDELRVHADVARALPEVDPDGRELLMSCGAALVNLRLAAAHHGHATTTEVVPEHRRDGLVARVRLEERRASTPESGGAVPGHPAAPHQPAAARRARAARGARDPRSCARRRRRASSLRPVEAPQRRAVAELIAEGDRLQWESPRFRREVSSWTRRNGTARRDGMPGYAAGMSDAAALVHPLRLRLSSPARDEADRDRRRALATKALLVLSTARDGKADWIAAGEALQRILLRAAAAGLSASYFNQPIECPELRERLREAVGTPGVPQILLRLGYGLTVRAPPRRPVQEVLRRMVETARRPAPIALWSRARRAPGERDAAPAGRRTASALSRARRAGMEREPAGRPFRDASGFAVPRRAPARPALRSRLRRPEGSAQRARTSRKSRVTSAARMAWSGSLRSRVRAVRGPGLAHRPPPPARPRSRAAAGGPMRAARAARPGPRGRSTPRRRGARRAGSPRTSRSRNAPPGS